MPDGAGPVFLPALPRYRPPAPWPLARQPNTLSLLVKLWRNPLTICGQRHFDEPMVISRTPIGHLSVISAPAAIKHVLVHNAENYPKDARQLRILQPGLKTGLLTASGERWRMARRTLAPLFAPRAVEAQAERMRDCAAAAVLRLGAEASGRPIDAGSELARLTFDVLSSVLFSHGTLTSSAEFAAALSRYFHSAGRIDPLDAIGAPTWLPRMGVWRAGRAIRYFEALVTRIVTARRQLLAAGTAPDDLLTRLLLTRDPQTGASLDEADIAGSIITFIGAGHETTANALAWTLFLLAQHRDVLARVEAELDASGAVAPAQWPEALPLTQAVILEAMRLYPPAPIMARVALRSDTVLNAQIPAGSTVIIAPYVVHRHKTLWRDPDLFCPERFLPGAREIIPEYAYLPFGVGPRVCIGQAFSRLEAVILLGTLLRRLRFTLPAGRTVFPVHHVTLRPWPALMMYAEHR